MITKKLAVFGVSLVFLLGSAAGAVANSKFQEIKAALNPALNVELNGELLAPMKAIIYEGTTYLPVRNIASMAALSSKIEYDQKNNKLVLGSKKSINVSSPSSEGFYQLIINGNWHPSLLTRNHLLYSNSYMGIEFYFESVEGSSLDSYTASALKAMGGKSTHQAELTLAKQKAKEISYETPGSVGKLAIVKYGSDYITLNFFVSKPQFKASDFDEFEKIKTSFNIQ
ncbi:hypothetical protein BK133_06565 [Paenibacillus sp. FSL H8-0548]|uniref:hypothetical protein n=1 Tax=Paenibacillus sp. FSL H8-0548 TaxID=1920422 RepID=UPI00096E9E69|nr:hypothetical protein [Paenibacillus sp. FSL H8-0548]OMF37260.1 hypothetical protein BK133_06565 [Paenibacillus sp. FSL H8-0548]